MQEPLLVGTSPDEPDEGGDPLWWVPLVTGSLWVLFALIVFRFDYTSVSAISILLGTVLLAAALVEAIQAAGSHGWWRVTHIGLDDRVRRDRGARLRAPARTRSRRWPRSSPSTSSCAESSTSSPRSTPALPSSGGSGSSRASC